MQKKILAFILFALIMDLCVWSPWIRPDNASRLAEMQFNRAWYGVADGCGSYGNDLGAKDFKKVPFGATVTLDYQCGLVMPNSPPSQSTIFVSFFDIAFGYPKP